MPQFHFFTAEYNSIVCMEHIIFIHSSAQRHLGWIYFLAIVNNQEQISTYNYSYKQLTRVIWTHPQVELSDIVFLYLGFLKRVILLFMSMCVFDTYGHVPVESGLRSHWIP